MIPRRQSATPLDEALGLLNLASRGRSPLARLRLAWTGICGALLARHCEPLSLHEGRLEIGVRGPDWREALYQQRRPLHTRVRQVAPEVREIRLVTTRRALPVAAAPTPPPVPADPRTLDVQDDGLRAALDGLLAARQRRALP